MNTPTHSLLRHIHLAFLSVLFAAVILTPAPEAREVEGIAAIVNDEVISLYDVDQRVELYFVSSGIVRSRETVERLREQALRELVDEKLQMQEARRGRAPVVRPLCGRLIGITSPRAYAFGWEGVCGRGRRRRNTRRTTSHGRNPPTREKC